ncbi:phosphoethanolamine transferase [uncultured Algibacter sp.]|uniref:phosphoethanolamine transferase n=1 Tax=uncultured Algibacter sp. TaxID=298659 RepID=UPI00260582C2|nr:phosphoethanolamine transferase [uncultured Algibacter sp.]
MVVRASIQYYKEGKKLGEYANDKYGNFKNVHRKWSSNDQEIYIIIIGEATSRLHFGLYDYYRDTTPLLGEIEDELLIYNDVISPETYTIASLTKALTLGNYENPNAKYDGSILQLLNQANFKTYWISNQKPIGVNDSHITKIGLGAKKAIFLNIKHSKEKTLFDGSLVEKMNEVLLEEGDKKIIFLHTLGAHVNYAYRYPDNFKFFNNQIPRSKFNEDYIYEQINAYDNAIRYSDYIIRTVIETIRKHNVISFVLYFSDHGEEVYDEIAFSGHFRDENLTKNIYEIPMVLWCSKKYQNKSEVSLNLDSKFMIDDIFHGIADLTGVNANRVDSTRSIFNKYFKDRKRIIRDTIDYDNFLN